MFSFRYGSQRKMSEVSNSHFLMCKRIPKEPKNPKKFDADNANNRRIALAVFAEGKRFLFTFMYDGIGKISIPCAKWAGEMHEFPIAQRLFRERFNFDLDAAMITKISDSKKTKIYIIELSKKIMEDQKIHVPLDTEELRFGYGKKVSEPNVYSAETVWFSCTADRFDKLKNFTIPAAQHCIETLKTVWMESNGIKQN